MKGTNNDLYRTKKSAFSNLFGLDYYYMRVIKNT